MKPMKPLLWAGLLVLAAVGCSTPVTNTGNTPGLTIHFSAPGRTVSADWQTLVARYEVTVTNTDGQGFAAIGPTSPSPANATSLTITGVSSGTWSITVNAFDGASALVASGTLTGVALPVASVTVPIVPLVTNGGTGDFIYQVSYPAPFADPQNLPIKNVTAALYYTNVVGHVDGELQGNPTVTVNVGAGTNTATTEVDGLASGTYRLELTFLRASGSVARKIQEAINVWDNVVSDRWIDATGTAQVVHALGESNFNSSNSQLLDLTATVDGVAFNFGGFSSSTSAYTATASSATTTQTLVLKATESQPGQAIFLSTDGKATFVPLKTATDSASLTLSQGTQTFWIRVQANGWSLDNSLFSDYKLDLTKVVPVTGVTLSGGNPSSLATDAAGQSWAASVVPSFADDTSLTWTSLDTSLADIDSATGVITPHLPGTVTLRATSTDGGFTAEATLTLTPSSFQVMTQQFSFWSNYPVDPPTGTRALAGSDSRLYALTDTQQVWWSDGAFWDEDAAMVPNAPAGVQWLGLLNDGRLVAASPTQVYVCDLTGTWTTFAAAPTPLLGVGTAFGVLWAAGADGSLWSWDGLWTNQGTTPAGTNAFGGTGVLYALGATMIRFDGSIWLDDGPTAPQTTAITTAFHMPTILVVR